MLSFRTRWSLFALLLAGLVFHFEPVTYFTSHGFDDTIRKSVGFAYNRNPRRYVQLIKSVFADDGSAHIFSKPLDSYNIDERTTLRLIKASLARDEQFLDNELHRVAGRPPYPASFFKSYFESVVSDYSDEARGEPFLFLELGCGTGAFARHLLRTFPNATVIGGDIHLQSMQLAESVLSDFVQQKRFHTVYWDLAALNASDAFDALLGRVDHVFLMGSLHFADSLSQIHDVIQQVFPLLKPGGLVSVGMLPAIKFSEGLYKTFIPRKYFHDLIRCNCIQARMMPSIISFVPRYSIVLIKRDLSSLPCESSCVMDWGSSRYEASRLFWRICFYTWSAKTFFLLLWSCHRIIFKASPKLVLSFPFAESIDSLLHLWDESEHYIRRAVRAFVFDVVVLGIIIMRMLPRW
eukprot:TRINITY_DN14424_c1_g1_i1.p1 TRINITY_DN14424_c1_g1~~TRINITY_DN14424_c1_g1_i1.p1  ORF type:complete len:407 (-),score=41.44 TRINITY_DN14424_c1_g1_i1:250-1470(-)